MRTETDEFECESGDKAKAIVASFNDETILFDCAYPMMTKKRENSRANCLRCVGRTDET